MKSRRHHNNKGYRQIKRDRLYEDIQRIARKLKIPTKAAKQKEKISEADVNVVQTKPGKAG